MRDILVTLLVFAGLPFALQRPVVGGLMWVWISVMNPHTQGWGFATTFPFAQLIAATTLLSVLKSREKNTLAMTPISVTLMCFVLWMNVTTPFALFPHAAWDQWSKVMKIMLMTFVVMMVVRKRDDVRKLVWVLVISLGYYGVKGGIFTIRSGGGDRVWGPASTFIHGNNEVALAFVMTIPLMWYLRSRLSHKWGRRAMLAAIMLTALAALGSYSRGAALAIAAMTAFFWFKTREKLVLGTLIAIAVPVLLAFMPSQWHERIDTIENYEEDSSAMGRINAWRMAMNLAGDRPLVGGGFEIYDEYVFALYAPNPEAIHAAHSIYFQILGEHGYVGLGLYLLLGFLTWRAGSYVAKQAAPYPELRWAQDLATMTQVGLLGFMVGGAFLSLAYFDVPYFLMVELVALRLLVAAELKKLRSRDAHAKKALASGVTMSPPLHSARARADRPGSA